MTEEMLAKLNDPQRAAVTAGDGPVLVLAGPGSGKTRVLTQRVAHLIEARGVAPWQILAVTFTNKAAKEMKERLSALLGEGRNEALAVGTFHSLCARFLRRDIQHLGRERNFAIYDSDDQQRVMRRVLRDLSLDEKKHPPRAIHAAISKAKNELIGPAAFTKTASGYFDEVVARCYTRYQQLLVESNALDFDDLLLEMVNLLQGHPDVLDRYHERYRYVLADEYQDTNRAQYVLLQLLAGKYRNLFVVGDEDQSIYAFRGADIRNIRSFEDDYPDAQVIMLDLNYRSTQRILDVAQAVINRSAQRRHPKSLKTLNGAGVEVQVHEAYTQDEEADMVAGEIARLHTNGIRHNDIAVMYRTNAQSRAVEESLRRRQIPYVLIGGVSFFERKEVKDMLGYLRLTANPFDSASFGRVINYPGRGIGDKTQDELERHATRLGLPLYAVLQLLADDASAAQFSFAPRIRTLLIDFLRLVDSFIAVRHEENLLDLFDRIVRTIGFQEALRREYGEEEALDRWNNVEELRNVASEYQHLDTPAQLSQFLEEAVLAPTESGAPPESAVTCITLHQAKGLEYPVVFLIGLEEGILPHSRSLDDRDALDEERRLFYVGATRAKDRLYLLHALRRTQYGRTAPSLASRFLTEIPPDLLRQAPRRAYSEASQASMFSQRSSFAGQGSYGTRPATRTPRPDPGSRTTGFFAGQKVRHGNFGEGIVVSSKVIENDEEVTVAFPGKGVKRLLASFAGLERLE